MRTLLIGGTGQSTSVVTGGGVMRAQFSTGLCIFLATCTIQAAAQEPPAAGPAHRLITAKDVDKLQEELDRAAANGYAVTVGWPGYEIATSHGARKASHVGSHRRTRA